MSDWDPAKEFRQLVKQGCNVFLTGRAGTGKSTLLRELAKMTDVDVVAPTGIAAMNAGGMTAHRWAGMGLGPPPGMQEKDFGEFYMRSMRGKTIDSGGNRIMACKRLVIDEISMLSGTHFRYLEWLFRKHREDETPWGGCQVIVIGDFLQLAPVRTNPRSPYDWSFATETWANSEFEPVELNTVHRQSDAAMLMALGKIREGVVDADVSRVLSPRVIPFPPNKVPRIYTHNAQVDKFNEASLAEIEGDPTILRMLKVGAPKDVEAMLRVAPAPEILALKVGARVICTANERNGLYVNGSIGTVVKIDVGGALKTSDGMFPAQACSVTVALDSGEVVDVLPRKWTAQTRQKEGDPMAEAIRQAQAEAAVWGGGGGRTAWGPAAVTQIPLRLAYALTVHRVQGLTLDSAYVDVRAALEPGQVYVALSRTRTLQGLMLKDWFSGVPVSRAALRFYEDGCKPSDSVNEAAEKEVEAV